MSLRYPCTLVGLFVTSVLAPACNGESSLAHGAAGVEASPNGGAAEGVEIALPSSHSVGGSPGPVTIGMDGSPPSGSGGESGSTRSLPTGEANCGKVTSSTSRIPADILIVLDRSGSMDSSTKSDNASCGLGGAACPSRWAAVTAAVKTTLDSTANSINWGLKLFTSPGGALCTVKPGAEVPIAATSVPAIEAQIAATSLATTTPTEQAILAATAYLKTVEDQNRKYILLATDGEPNCPPTAAGLGTSSVKATRNAIAAASAAGFPVYVIGIGPSVSNLDGFAKAGGTGKFFSAASAQALTDAFLAISKAVATCVFTSTTPPPDPNNVAVYLNNSLIAKDPAHGWSLSDNGQDIVLNGTSCATITNASTSNVQVLFGCPDVPPPPIL